jgi:hypothetical protein
VLDVEGGDTVHIHKLRGKDFRNLIREVTDGISEFTILQKIQQTAAVKADMLQLVLMTPDGEVDGEDGVSASKATVASSGVEEADAKVQAALKSLMGRIAQVPELAMRIITATARKGKERDDALYSEDEADAWDYDDQLRVLGESLMVNIVRNQKLRDFFGAMRAAWEAALAEMAGDPEKN